MAGSTKRPPHIVRPDPAAKTHPGQGRGRTFHSNHLPPGFHTIVSPATAQPWRDLPAPTGLAPFHLKLGDLLSDAAMLTIRQSGRLVFHAVGDTGGVKTPTPQEIVVRYMERDFATAGDVSGNPSFFYHLGDVVYYAGETPNYYSEFYEPYNLYPAPIFAIPGNHDGDVNPTAPEPSLAAFVRNFCAQAPVHTPEAHDAARQAMTQPNVFWTLEAELATIVGLYSNCPEGGQVGDPQVAWFRSELALAPKDRALIVAVHHPIYSAYGPHPGSQHLKDMLEAACTAAGRIPDLVLTGHVHDYQRFTAGLGGRDVTFVVAGAGGYNSKLHMLSKEFHSTRLPIQLPGSDGTLENFCDTQHGYLRIEVTSSAIHGEYYAVPNVDPSAAQLPAIKPFETWDIPLGQAAPKTGGAAAGTAGGAAAAPGARSGGAAPASRGGRAGAGRSVPRHSGPRRPATRRKRRAG